MSVPALRALPVPDTEPAPEAAPVERTSWLRSGAARTPGRDVQGVLTLLVSEPSDNQDQDEEDDDGPVRPRTTASCDLPAPAQWGRRLVQVVIEVLAATRPASQLVRWSTQDVYDQIVSRIACGPRPAAGTPRPRLTVCSVRVCEPADGIAEVSAVIRGQHRVQAVAVRLEGRDGRWVLTALQTG